MTARSYLNRRFAPAFFCILFGLAGPSGWVPETEAARSKDKKKIKKLKKQSNALRFTILNLQTQLAAAQRPVPDPASFVEMVGVGNVGNATDAGNASEASVYGAVNYEYRIGKYEVTLAQYTAFLNAVAATDTYDLYNTEMASDLNVAGIVRSGTPGSSTYALFGSGNRPVAYVSWFDAARFCNWLHNGRPAGAQDADTTERGAYTLDGATSGVGFTRNPGADYWIPSEDEWYKAAYHQPSDQGGDADDYWLYPTASNSAPGNEIGPSANHANHYDGTVYSVTQSGSYDSSQNYLTDGGVYGGSPSFYGTFDQGGNLFEWNDTVIDDSDRGMRGGSWSFFESDLRSSSRNSVNPDQEFPNLGFRVASP